MLAQELDSCARLVAESCFMLRKPSRWGAAHPNERLNLTMPAYSLASICTAASPSSLRSCGATVLLTLCPLHARAKPARLDLAHPL